MCDARRLLVVFALALVVIAPVRAQDPDTLEAAAAEVAAMRERGASWREIAEYVTEVVDGRITNGNGMEGDFARYWDYYAGNDETFNRWTRYEDERERLPETPGREYEARARWAWDLRYGHCAETSAIAYLILRRGGVPARIMEIPGHSFTIVGDLPDGARVDDMTTWGNQVSIADGWYGQSGRVIDGINRNALPAWDRGAWGFPRDPRRGDVTVTAYDSDVRYEQEFVSRGTITGSVIDAATREPMVGATVDIHGDVVRTSTAAGAGGRFGQGRLPVGTYQVTARANGRSASASVTVQGRGAASSVELVLPADPDAGVAGTVSIVSPVDGAILNEEALAVSGSLEGLDATRVELLVNGASIEAPVADGQFAARATLRRGRNTLQARAGGVSSPVVTVSWDPTGDPWVGHFRGQATAVMVQDGARTETRAQLELTVTRIGGGALQLDYGQGQSTRVEIVPGEPPTASTQQPVTCPMVPPGFTCTATMELRLVLREGRLHFEQRTHSRAEGSLPGGPHATSEATGTTTAVLDRVAAPPPPSPSPAPAPPP
jgi:hypothetical protein